MTLSPKQKLDLLDRGFSRRNLGKIAGINGGRFDPTVLR